MLGEWKDYINIFFAGFMIVFILALIELASGYSYSKQSGIYAISNTISNLFINTILAIVFLFLDIIYVQLKRRYKKKGMYKKDK